MKITTIVACFLSLAPVFATFGAADDTLIAVSTPGPDCYADGTVVRDGEYYALVWVKNGASFAGIRADGSPVDPETSKILCYLPAARGGHCEERLFEIDSALKSELSGGDIRICLLDTRSVGGAVASSDSDGVPLRVNAHGSAKSVGARYAASSITTLSAASGRCALTPSAVPEGTPCPSISGFSVVDGEIRVEVADTVSCLQYTLAGGESLDDMSPISGDGASADGVGAGSAMTLRAAAGTSSGSFFRVVRKAP